MLKRASAILFALCLAASAMMAQVTASISGRIEDQSGAAVPGATVTATSLETGTARTATTDEGGNYRLLSLPVGHYELKAEKTGFKTQAQSGITLVVAQQAVMNLRLEIGEVQQQVTVTGEAPLVNTSTASLSGLVGEQQVKDLPLNGRSFDNLITLNAGAINITAMKSVAPVAPNGNVFSVSGRLSSENQFLLNGVEFAGPSIIVTQPGGVSGELLGVDAVREFNVLTDTYSVEYGKRAGAQIGIVTSSGTNQLHGSVFEFLRNSDLDARNFYDRPTGERIPPFRRNQFGGSVGGPIKKDKSFIFGSYEGFRQRLALSSLIAVPDLAARQGLLPNAQGVETPVANLNPAMLPYMSYWPLPTPGTELGGGVAQTFSNPRQVIAEDFATARVDHNFSEKDQLAGAYTIDNGTNTTPNGPVFASFYSLRAQVASLQETHLFSPTTINTLTLGFTRAGYLFESGDPIVPIPSNAYFVPGSPVPGGITFGSILGSTSVSGAGATTTSYEDDYKDIFTLGDGLQIVRGKHQISIGGGGQKIYDNFCCASRTQGVATFASLTTFLQGTTSSFQVVPQPIAYEWRYTEGNWYAQDSVQLRPNLTVRFGLRDEFDNGLNEATGRAANYLLTNGVVNPTTHVGSSGLTANNAKLLLSPRVGMAWDVFGNGKTAVRAGFGIYYDMQDALGYIISVNPPYNGTEAFSNVALQSVVPVVPSRASQPPPCGPGVPAPCTTYAPQGVQPNFKVPTIQEWNVTLEQGITPNTSLRLSYAASRGYHEMMSADMNTIQPQICSNAAGCVSGGINKTTGSVPQGAQYIPVGTRPDPYLTNGYFWEAEAVSFYDSMRVELTHRFNAGLEFRANYTWSRNLDTQGELSSAQAGNSEQMVMDPYNVQRDWGPSAQNIPQTLTFSGSYELPFGQGKPWLNGLRGAGGKLVGGWQVNSIITWLSNFPFTILTGTNQSGNGDARTPDRPSVNPAFTGPVITGNPNKYYNPNAFSLPVSGTWGNLGRETMLGPGLVTLDLSLFKTTQLTERTKLQFRAEFFNTLNHVNFANPNGNVFTSSGINPTAGLISATTTTSRQIQFGLKLIF